MFGTIRKHQTWLWWFIVVVVIAGMATFNQMNRSGNGQRGGGNRGEIDGKPITDGEFQNAWNETALMYFLRTQEWPDVNNSKSGWNQELQTYQRLWLIRKLQQYNIHADNDSVAQLASLILKQIGKGQNVPLDAFEAQILRPKNITAEDFQRFIEHDVSIQQLISVIGASGKLVPPSEIESLYIETHQDVKVDAVVFSASNYLATIPEPEPAVLAQFYTNQVEKYKVPDQMQVSYVRFNVTNYLAEAEHQIGTNINNKVEDAFRQLGTNALTLGKTEADEKAKIRELIIRNTALSNANNTAVPFQKELMAKDLVRPDNLNAMAKEKGLEVKVSKPFDKEYGPSDLQLQAKYISELINLTSEEPFLYAPVPAEDGIYIFAFNKAIPSRVPPLEEIRGRVVADFKEFEATRTAQLRARLFEETATNGLARGQTFAEIAKGARVIPVQLPPFSLSSETLPELEDEVDPNTFKQSVLNTPAGKVTGLIPTRTGGMVAYVRERVPIDKAKMQVDLPYFSKTVRQARETQAFDMWFEREASGALRNIPALQQQAQQQGRS
jgi:hypothetical protein